MGKKESVMPEDEKLNLKAVQAKTQTGRDPVIEKKALDYSKRDWQLTVEPLLAMLSEDEQVNVTVRSAFRSDAFIAKIQKAMVDHKYEVLEKADDTKNELAKSDLLFARKS